MRIVRYKGQTMQDALQQVRGELGPDAIILSTRALPPRLRWLGKEQVEVVAAVGSRVTQPPHPPRQSEASSGAASLGPLAVGGNGHRGAVATELRPADPDPPFVGPRATNSEPRVAASDIADLHREIREIRETLGRLMAWTAPKDDLAEMIVARLVERGMSGDLARELTKGVGPQSWEAAWEEVRAAVAARIRVSGPLLPEERPETRDQRPETAEAPVQAPRRSPMVVALVGPTGVGKTTTIAKLAARHAIMERRRVALVTLDTYRVAAVDQIRTYAQMLEIPLEVVVSADDAGAVLARLRDHELILVDTIGHGPNDEMQLGQLRALLAGMNPDQVHLVLAAPTDRRTLENAVARFSRLGPTHLLFTKVDEAVVFGGMVEVAVRADWPVSYVSYGQDVPENIAPAAPEQLAAAACQEER